MSPENTKPTPSVADDEIDLIALAKTFWSGRRTILISVLICGVLGFFIAIFSAKEFVATTIMVPSGNDASSKLGGLGGLGGLAAMAGINLSSGSSGGDLSPNIYPQIIASVPFQLELMKTPLTFSGINEPVTLFDYYTKTQKPNLLLKYTLGLPGVILTAIKGEAPVTAVIGDENKPFELTGKQQKIREILTELVSLQVNAKEGFLTLSATMPEARAAAELGQQAQGLLQQYITESRIKKAKANLDFIQQRFDETAQKYDAAQQRLASFRDRNKNVSLATSKTEEEKLSSQFNLIYSIYSELAKQLEQAKIQVKQDTPVFTIIEPITVPMKKTKPNRPMILFIWLFLGGVIGTAVVFGREYVGSVKKQWKDN
ncbi:MAG: exopolysaccharide biosynthesis protein [Mariniphaga sp.]|nr:exopolysaccharide biosynthesis protein [Mariniphaga sp.]